VTEPRPPPPRVRIDPAAMDAVLVAHKAAVGGHAEPCGLLLGGVSTGIVRVQEVRPLANVHPTPDRAFLLPAPGAVAAAREARERGLAIVGVWHGHLHGPAALSEADAAGLRSATRGPGADGKPSEVPYVFLVSGGGAGSTLVVRAFLMHDARPREVDLASHW
jgi:proteasome lid subunit RPN8/RPN11